MSCKQASSKKSKVVSYNRSMLLLIGSSDEGALKKLSLFAIQKGLVGLATEPKHVTKLKKWVIVGREFDREIFQMSSQVDINYQCINQCRHISLLIHCQMSKALVQTSGE